MRNLLKCLKDYWRIIILILLFLVVQAYCELTLPGYTSDIVDVGIQQGGIDETVPDKIGEQDFEQLLALAGEQAQEIVAAYEKEDGVYVLKASIRTAKEDSEEYETLQKAMQTPMAIIYMLSQEGSGAEEIQEQLRQILPEESSTQDATAPELLLSIPDQIREQLLTSIEEQVINLPDTILEQASVAYVQQVYENLGEDMWVIQIRYILRIGAKMLGLAFLGMAASVIVGLLASRTAAGVGRDLRRKVFQKVVGFSHAEFDKFSTASLITRSTNDIQQIQQMSVFLLRIVIFSPIMGIGGVLKVLNTNVSMTWILALAVGVVMLMVLLLFILAMPKFRALQSLLDRLNLITREILTGLPVIRAFSTEKHEEERFDKANRDLTRTNLFVNRTMTFMMPGMMLIMNSVAVLIVWVGARGIENGQMQVGDMMAFIQYAMQIIISFLMICIVSIMLPRAMVAAGRVQEVLASETVIRDPAVEKEFPEQGQGELTFHDVSFYYPGAKEEALHHISFTAKPGEVTAIIGSTGSGKSTLIHLIPRFYEVTSGSITIDGIDIREVSCHRLREQLGYVPQKGMLFSGTIASNIKYSDATMPDEQMEAAAQVAQAEEFIRGKELGYDAPIAQGGSNVSGGQKQRLSIARAVAGRPKIYLFDDSFSALDYKTDVTLRKALKAYTKDSTVLIVAQRISTILHADQILVLEDGKIVGKGRHEDLLKDCEVYRQIATSQLSAEELKKGGISNE